MRGAPKLTDKDIIVLAQFKNSTGDPVFDETLRHGSMVELQQSLFLSLVPDERIQATLAFMGQPADTRLTPELARHVCARTEGAAVLEGSISQLGSQYVLGVSARNCHTGGILDEEQTQSARKEDVVNALSQIAGRFRTRVGESLATVEKHSRPLAEAPTPSLDALKAFSNGMQVWTTAGGAAALPHIKRGIELDHNFAMAYAIIGRIYGNLGESVLNRKFPKGV